MLLSNTVALTAASTNSNILAGTIYEILPCDGMLAIGLTESSASEGFGLVKLDFICGGEIEMFDYSPRHTGATASPPIIPDDFTLSCGGLAGDRIILKARNTGAVTHNLIYLLMFNEA